MVTLNKWQYMLVFLCGAVTGASAYSLISKFFE